MEDDGDGLSEKETPGLVVPTEFEIEDVPSRQEPVEVEHGDALDGYAHSEQRQGLQGRVGFSEVDVYLR